MSAHPGLEKWPLQMQVKVAWGDMDAFNHVNNTVYLRWFESARIAYFEKTGMIDEMRATGVGPILARATVDYRIPLTYPDEVSVVATVASFGTTSFLMKYRIASSAHGGKVAAEGEGVVVMVDYKTGGKAPVPAALRARIEALERGGGG